MQAVSAFSLYLYWSRVDSSLLIIYLLDILHFLGVVDAFGHVSVRNADNPSQFFMWASIPLQTSQYSLLNSLKYQVILPCAGPGNFPIHHNVRNY